MGVSKSPTLTFLQTCSLASHTQLNPNHLKRSNKLRFGQNVVLENIMMLLKESHELQGALRPPILDITRWRQFDVKPPTVAPMSTQQLTRERVLEPRITLPEQTNGLFSSLVGVKLCITWSSIAIIRQVLWRNAWRRRQLSIIHTPMNACYL
ncbi:hypothetical protein BKA65DRAFT_102834 [Rhexocercosporidium sp. MPI-PUGE-AT-0058]|nr:hypothetical protein BKA65DRAFT_102834 [Rhexocercosporidium sp. MPI-PUGE-AT-0058]